jgi:hypothetical protein
MISLPKCERISTCRSMRQDNNTICFILVCAIEQAEVLKQLLEKEKEEVWDSGDLLLLFVIIILLGFVISFLGNKEIDLKSLNKTIDDFIYGKKKKK